ncbi:sacsin N-terminal ATP-binding-like domain-containing protein [Mesorhizobium sp. LjRoot246]|uniref:sacsin N-terminal ATP-binding-like domain-containing protein n=1 Tax=Mesorhizobium sp. LjRoot246 TaxID=3342294 RepID=UPI003ECC59EC
MPDLHTPPVSILDQIKNNLRDRYDTGYPILKELLQNADDAEAGKFRLDGLPGWSTATNPLLRGPGLLVVNDGFFREEDKRGILSFGASGKAADSATIGKFGFGQKAVFHLCDAFVVYARTENDETFSTIVNPFLNVDVSGNISRQWEPPDGGLDPADLELLRREVSSDFPHRHLLLWLPLRRKDIQPAPGVGFSTNIPLIEGTIGGLNRPGDLRILLTALRHLKFIEIRECGELRCALELDDTQGRFLGPNRSSDGVRSFGGAIRSAIDNSTAPFVGREAMIPDSRLASLKRTQHWPQTISVLSPEPVSEKGEPHGATTLLRASPGATDRAEVAQLRVSWAVFLPISDASDFVIPVDGSALGRFHLLLHGYFFLDSGRRRIEGLDAPAEHDEPADASALRRAWNAELRDTVVLPLLPTLLRDALDSAMVTSAELAELVSALARHEWFRSNQEAICREHALARVLEAPGSIVWRVVSSGDVLRPLPASVADAPRRLEELFRAIGTWAGSSGVRLVVDDSTALSARSMRWTSEDLDAVFSGLSSRAFQSRDLARLLVDFLNTAVLGNAERSAIRPHLVAALRKAMTETQPLASSELVKLALGHVPHGVLFPLPASVENRQVLRVLATAPANILPVRSEWLDESQRRPRLSNPDLKTLLASLEPLIGGDHADQAATAALALLAQGERNISELARDPEFAPIKVLRARDVRLRSPIVLSLQTLVERSQAGLLFANSPQANSWLPLLVDALRDVSPLIVEGSTVQLLRDMDGATPVLQSAGKDSASALINKAMSFGSESARQRLITELGTDTKDDPAPARRLCAGFPEAGYSAAKLWTLDTNHQRIERIATAFIERSQNEFLVPASIADGLARTQRNHLRIAVLDTANLETLFDKNIAAIEQVAPTLSEREAILETDLTNDLLIRLPVHERQDGTLGDGRGVFRAIDEWPVPGTLQAVVSIVQPCRSRKARERQEQLIEVWSPQRQIQVALAQAKPHRFRGEVLDALAKLTSQPEERLLETLRAKPWLLADEQPVGPQDVLALPPTVDEAARALLLKRGEAPPFLPVAKLAIDVRGHQGFDHLQKWVLPDRRSSFNALALMIEDARIIGRLGAANGYPVDDFSTLASDGGDLGLPGWPLLAAVLSSSGDSRDDVTKIVAAFADLDASNAKLAGTHLDSLATAAEKGQKGDAARRAFRHGFSVVAWWPEDARRQVFGGTRVLTEAGSWRSAREVVQDGDGLDPRHILARDYTSILGRRELQHAGVPDAEDASVDLFAANLCQGEIRDVDLVALEAQSADQQRSFLDAWKGCVPSDLVIVYLGLIGRSEPFRRLANEWATDATAKFDTLWADLDNHFPREILYPNTLAAEVDQRRFLVEPVAGDRVQAIAMSGDPFDAPLGGPDKGILIGNLHRTHEGIRVAGGKVRSLITLPVRQVDPSEYSQREASGIFRRFVETIAVDCLWLGMERQRTALQGILDKAVKVDQSTIEETERLLQDRLPTILAELKLPTEYRSQKALREYQAEESRLHHLSAPAQKMEELKAELWRKICDGALAAELLSAVRGKIGDFGYSASRVLFELFQNADDAYRQYDGAATDACFRVELPDDPGGFRVVHWGRPINHMGRDAEEGRRLGHDRDLLNMLLMNFSEKRPGDDLTGKFGLGFKSVHVLSESVGIASGWNRVRTVGGFLPAPWPEGAEIGESRKRSDGRKATVIDVPFSTETADKGAEAVAAFRAAMTWLPAFARTIRRVEIEGSAPVSIDCGFSPLLNESAIDIVSISGSNRERALRFDLSGGYGLLLRIDAAGPRAFPDDLRRLWNLAPLEEEVRSGWLLNGPFAVDPGRTGLAGSINDRQEKFRTLGQTLGDRLLKLHDLADADWCRFAEGLDLDTSRTTAWDIFWSHLFDVLVPDFDGNLGGYLHADGRGYGNLAGQRQVIPTHLPAPFASLVRAAEAEHYTDGALSDSVTLSKVRDWPTLTDLQNRIIASDVAGQLRKLGFGSARPLRFSTLLRRQIGEEKRVNPELAQTLSRAVTPQSIRETPLDGELHEILDIARQALFLAQDGTWRIAQLPFPDAAGDDEERRLCAFAPAKHLLDERYTGPALEFFRVARERSGFGPQARDLGSWAAEISAEDHDRQTAALRYVIEGRQGRELSEEIRRSRPSWLPWPTSRLRDSELLSRWTEKEKDDLLYALQGRGAFEPAQVLPPPKPEPETVLRAIYTWWASEAADLRASYSLRTYPDSFSPSQLRDASDRSVWFTMFALGCFQSFGRTQDGQHRSFIESGRREGWWPELAESRPPDDVQSWLERLERWSAPQQFDQRYLLWRRSFVELYAVARWLDEYREIAVKLPRIIEDHGVISLNGALQPSYWAPAMRLCIDAAPINRSLGIGMNWMIREMLRYGVYDLRDEGLMAPYCWAASQRVRTLLNELGADLGERADKEASRSIYEFIVKHVGVDHARFAGDFDLPLQLITRGTHKPALTQCFAAADRDPPTFEESDDDNGDEFTSEMGGK